jgi:predicted amidohydrolase YtcJ
MYLLYNADVYTMDGHFTIADSMAFDEGTIVEIGDHKKLTDKYPDAIKIDGNGLTALPGFIDPHIHFLLGAFFNGSLDCTPEKVPDISSLKKCLREIAQKLPKERWVVGQGYDPVRYPDKKNPTRYQLDDACPDHPVMIVHYSCHEVVVNSIGLDLLGIDGNTPQPRAGEIEKDRKGVPTGRLIETVSGGAISMAVLDVITHREIEIFEKVKEAEHLLFSLGITRIGDPAVSSGERAFYEKMVRKDILKIPVVAYPASDGNMYDLPCVKADMKRINDDDTLPMTGPVKFFLDGADRAALRLTILQGLSVFIKTISTVFSQKSFNPIRILLRSPSRLGRDLRFHLGVMMADTNDLVNCVKTAVKNGHPVAFHAIGNEAIEQAVYAVNASGVSRAHAIPHRLEHALFLSQENIRAVKKAGLAIATQPAFLSHMGSDNMPPINGLKILPIRTFIDSGIHVSGSSDWPVVSCNPLLAVERAVTRRTIDKEVLQKEEAISIKEAISMYTREASYVLGQTNTIGSLEPGKRSDFILLSKNPFEQDPEDISAIHVEKTYLGGELVFTRNDHY